MLYFDNENLKNKYTPGFPHMQPGMIARLLCSAQLFRKEHKIVFLYFEWANLKPSNKRLHIYKYNIGTFESHLQSFFTA